MLSKIGDGHTCINQELDFNYFPLKVYEFSDGYHVLELSENFKHLIGKKLVKIGTKNISEVKNLLSQATSSENEYWIKYKLPSIINCAHYLLHFGIMDNKSFGLFTFEDSEGNNETIRLLSKSGIKFQLASIQYEMNIDFPFSYQRRNDYYWHRFYEEDKNNILFVQYNKCSRDPFWPIEGFIDNVLNLTLSH